VEDQEIFPTTLGTKRNMGENKHRKSTAFAIHQAKVFQPNLSENEPEEEQALTHLLETPYQLEPPINLLKSSRSQQPKNK
jgi:hypothetical protein